MNCCFLFADIFEISIKKTSISYGEKNQFVSIELDYTVKNKHNYDIFLYDLNKGNDMQYEEDSFIENKVKKNICI